MIIATGLTPAWQQIVLLNELHPGEVNRARAVRWCASGKVLNVALALHHLGASAKTVTLVGGPNGAAIQEEFRQLNIPARWILSRTPTRVCTTLLDTARQQTTELVENSAPVDPAELDQARRILLEERNAAHTMILSGSLPQSTPPTFYRDAIRGYRGRVILDARGEELLLALPERPFLVKPNREELARTVGRQLRDDADLIQAMQELNRQGAHWVVITQGKNTVLATHAGQVFRLLPPAVENIVNPIGCGDSMAATIGWALSEGHPPVEAIRHGMAAAANNLAQLLPARLSRTEIERISREIREA